MANVAANFPIAKHTRTDISALTSGKLGQTSPTHVDVHGKLEEEIYSTQDKLGTGASVPSSETFLKGNGAGTSEWKPVSDITNMALIYAIAL